MSVCASGDIIKTCLTLNDNIHSEEDIEFED